MTQGKDPSPSEFYAAFRRVVDPRKTDFPQHWRNNARGSDYTALMLGDMLPAVARELGTNCYGGSKAKNYYLLDGVLYHERDKVHFPAEHEYVKYISPSL